CGRLYEAFRSLEWGGITEVPKRKDARSYPKKANPRII
ncbi:hypothetical protein NPIL_608211, partial [Nephila pilipes]